MALERDGDAAGEAGEHELERDDLGERGQADVAQGAVEDRVDDDAAEVVLREPLDLRQPVPEARADDQLAQERRVRDIPLILEPELLEQVVQDALGRRRRRDRVQERDELGGPQVRPATFSRNPS